MPGVHSILTGTRCRDHVRSARSARWCRARRRDGSPAAPAPQPALARDMRTLRRRSGRVRRGRHAAPGQGCGRSDRDRLRNAARRRRASRTRSSRARQRLHEAYPDNQSYLFEVGDKAAVERAFARRRPRGQASHGDQPHHHQLDGAARLPRRIRSRATTATRCAARCRARTSSAARSRAKCSKSPKTRCASFRKMSAAASA